MSKFIVVSTTRLFVPSVAGLEITEHKTEAKADDAAARIAEHGREARVFRLVSTFRPAHSVTREADHAAR